MYYKLFEIAIFTLISLVSYYILPELKKFLQKISKNADGTVNKDAVFWTNTAVKVIEKIKGSGNGALKKETVVNYIKQLNISLTDEELSSLIDLIVGYYNTSGWEKDILEALEGGK